MLAQDQLGESMICPQSQWLLAVHQNVYQQLLAKRMALLPTALLLGNGCSCQGSAITGRTVLLAMLYAYLLSQNPMIGKNTMAGNIGGEKVLGQYGTLLLKCRSPPRSPVYYFFSYLDLFSLIRDHL